MYSTIQIAGHITAQGQVLRRLKDGRVEIDAGGSRFVGYPVATAPAAHARASFRDSMIAALSHGGGGRI